MEKRSMFAAATFSNTCSGSKKPGIMVDISGNDKQKLSAYWIFDNVDLGSRNLLIPEAQTLRCFKDQLFR